MDSQNARSTKKGLCVGSSTLPSCSPGFCFRLTEPFGKEFIILSAELVLQSMPCVAPCFDHRYI